RTVGRAAAATHPQKTAASDLRSRRFDEASRPAATGAPMSPREAMNDAGGRRAPVDERSRRPPSAATPESRRAGRTQSGARTTPGRRTEDSASAHEPRRLPLSNAPLAVA